MPDTIRDYDAFQNASTGLFADNTAGDISAQDLRDFVATVYGSRYVTSQTSTYAATAGDEIILMDANGSDREVTLPAVSSSTHMSIVVVKTDSGADLVTINPNSTETINGDSDGLVLRNQYESVRLVCDGSEWFTIAYDYRPISEVVLHTGNGHGSTDTAIRRFTTKAVDTGAAITHATSAANGDTLTINEDGLYHITYDDFASSSSSSIGFSLNSAALTTNIGTLSYAQGKLVVASSSGGGIAAACSILMRLSTNDVIRPHTNKSPDNANDNTNFRIIKVAN